MLSPRPFLSSQPLRVFLCPLAPSIQWPCGKRSFIFGSPPENRSMSYKEKRLLGYSQAQMFAIAADVGRYVEFVPWCNESLILRKTTSGALIARLGVGFPPLSESYDSTVTLQVPGMVKVNFQFKNQLYAKVAGLFFDQVVTMMVSAFLDRARVLHGPASIPPQKPEVLASVLTQRVGRSLLISLNRPNNANRLNRATAQLLDEVLKEKLEDDDEIFGGVLCGEGMDFCTGLDFEELLDKGFDCLDDQSGDLNRFAPKSPTWGAFSKPLIAAISGRAIGAGLELALACDLRIAEQDSILGLHPRKYCMPMMGMGTARLPALIGLSRALDLTLTGRHVTAPEALQFGLVNQVAKVGTAVGIAMNLMQKLCNLPGQEALLADRASILHSSGLSHEVALREYSAALRALEKDGLEETQVCIQS